MVAAAAANSPLCQAKSVRRSWPDLDVEAETTALQDAGAVAVRLGPHILRTASAGPVALAVLAQRAGLWG
mgnify:FL=1